MKQIVCEMCESTEFLKEDGIFICQGCGMKYSIEDAKKLMVEIDGSAAPKSGNTDRVANMLTLARNAIDQANNSEAEDYANKILEIDSANAEAWLIKGVAVGWQSKLNNIRFSEMASCFEHAMENASEDQIETFKEEIGGNAMRVSKAFLNLTTGNFSKYPSADNVADIQSAITAMLDLSVKVILLHVDWDSDDMDDYFSSELNSAAVTGSNKADKDYGPDQSDKNKYAYDRWINESDNCLSVLGQAMVFANSVPRVESIVKNYRIINQNVIDSCSYKFEADGYWSGYVKDFSLTDGAKSSRRTATRNFETKGSKRINEIKEKARKEAEEAQRAKNEAYWEEHAEEKKALENEKAELSKRISDLEAEIKKIQEEISPELTSLYAKLKEKLPEEKAVADQKAVIDSLTQQRQSLGLFKGKEKKALDARINDEETPKLNTLTAAAKAKRDAVDADLKAKIAVLKNKDNAQKKEIKDAQNRIKQIDTELTMNR